MKAAAAVALKTLLPRVAAIALVALPHLPQTRALRRRSTTVRRVLLRAPSSSPEVQVMPVTAHTLDADTVQEDRGILRPQDSDSVDSGEPGFAFIGFLG